MSDDNRIWKSLEKLHDKVDKNTNTLLENTKDLEYHIKRTNILEDNLVAIDDDVNKLTETQNSFLTIIKFLLTVLTVVSVVVGLVMKFGIL